MRNGTDFKALVFFSLLIMVLGNLPPSLLFALDPKTSLRIAGDKLPIPKWVFVTVWLIIYPMMGAALGLVWRLRKNIALTIPLTVFAVTFVCNLSFWLTNSIWMTAVIDGINLSLAMMLAVVFYQYEKMTLWFLFPLLVWMPTTLGFKIWAVLQGIQ